MNLNFSTSDLAILNHACLVVAHPDDEILWFSSILSRVDRAIVCFLGNPAEPERGPARRRVLEQFPTSNIETLGLDVPLAEQWWDGSTPEVTEFGIKLPKSARGLYEKSFGILQRRLRTELSGFANVITHNPWGEYGHEVHIQVHRVVASLAGDLGYRMWFSNYASAKTTAFADEFIIGPYAAPICLPTNVDLAQRVRDLYVAESCWTVPLDHVWLETECFNRFLTDGERATQEERNMFPLNYVPWEDVQTRPSLHNRALRRGERILRAWTRRVRGR